MIDEKPVMKSLHLGSLLTIGQRLYALRCFYSKTLSDVAEFTGISKATLSRMERDIGEITVKDAKTLADYYEISIIRLIA